MNVAVTCSVSPLASALSPPENAPTAYSVPVAPPFVLTLVRAAPPTVTVPLIANEALDALLSTDWLEGHLEDEGLIDVKRPPRAKRRAYGPKTMISFPKRD